MRLKQPAAAHVLAALLLAGLGAVLGATGCRGGKVLFNASDPKQCATGHGCPMVVCSCNDGSFMIDSTCELGECIDDASICADRCEDYEGTKGTLETPDDDVGIPACDLLGQRMFVNGCKIDEELLASTCQEDDLDCSFTASEFWSCVVGRGILACKRGALRVEGCSDVTPELCTVPQTTP